MLWDGCKFTTVSPGLLSDALHLHISASKRFLALPAVQGLGHREEEGWVQEEQPSTLMMLQPGCRGWELHGDSKHWWSPAAAQRSGKIKSSIKVEQVALVDYNQKWLQLLSRSSDPKDHELCGPWIPSAAPHAGLQHLKVYCVLD